MVTSPRWASPIVGTVSPAILLISQVTFLAIMLWTGRKATAPDAAPAWESVLFLVGWLYHVAYFGWALLSLPPKRIGSRALILTCLIAWISFAVLLGVVAISLCTSGSTSNAGSGGRAGLQILPFLSLAAAILLVLPASRLGKGEGGLRYLSILFNWIALAAGPSVPGLPSVIQLTASRKDA